MYPDLALQHPSCTHRLTMPRSTYIRHVYYCCISHHNQAMHLSITVIIGYDSWLRLQGTRLDLVLVKLTQISWWMF